MAGVPPYSIIVPAFNEVLGLPKVLDELVRACPGVEIIVVDDGSTDATAAVARDFPVTVVSHVTNRGYGAALKSGIRSSRFPWIFYTDGDNQFDLEELPAFIRASVLRPKRPRVSSVSGA